MSEKVIIKCDNFGCSNTIKPTENNGYIKINLSIMQAGAFTTSICPTTLKDYEEKPGRIKIQQIDLCSPACLLSFLRAVADRIEGGA